MTKKNINLSEFKVNNEFCLSEYIFIDCTKAVIFSPFTSETLLCERRILDFFQLFQDNANLSLEDIEQNNSQDINDILTKLISMRIILLKE